MSKEEKYKTLTSDLKIIIIGKSGSGKTSFVNKWVKNEFDENYKPTIVSEYNSKIYKYEDKIYNINVWDIAGQDRYAAIIKSFSKNTQGCITMSDVMNPNSLTETLAWKKNLDENELLCDGGKIPNVLIENKVDLVEENEAKDISQLEEFCKKNEFDACFKTSAKTGYNIKESMEKLISIIIKRLNAYSEKNNNLNRNTLAIDPDKHSEKDKYRTKQSGCC